MFWESSDPIAELRLKQDALNLEISQLLLRRLHLSLQIIQEKAKHGVPVKDLAREQEIILNITQGEDRTAAEKKFLAQVFTTILDQSCKFAEIQMDKKSDQKKS